MCYKQSVAAYRFAIALAFFAVLSLSAQCPSVGRDTEVRSLRGRLVFHDALESWFELKLDQPQCGEASFELFHQDSNSLAVLRGCRIKSLGAVIVSARGNIRQIVEQVEAVGRCVHKRPFPNYSSVKPGSEIREYRVEMHLDGDHPIHFRISRAGQSLRPWQAYASYFVAGGGFLLYGACADGFVVDRVRGTPEANPKHFEEARGPSDMAMLDLERAAEQGKKDQHLEFTCARP